MPVLSRSAVSIISPAQPFDRLAFRCSFAAELVDGALAPASSLSLHATRYRKPAEGLLEACGLVGHGEVGAALSPAEPADAALMADICGHCLDYLGIKGDARVDLNFAWRAEDGDVTGMAMLTVTPASGEPISRATGNSNELETQDAAFAAAFARVIGAIAGWCANKGW